MAAFRIHRFSGWNNSYLEAESTSYPQLRCCICDGNKLSSHNRYRSAHRYAGSSRNLPLRSARTVGNMVLDRYPELALWRTSTPAVVPLHGHGDAGDVLAADTARTVYLGL